jgi:hypothetical protein
LGALSLRLVGSVTVTFGQGDTSGLQGFSTIVCL